MSETDLKIALHRASVAAGFPVLTYGMLCMQLHTKWALWRSYDSFIGWTDYATVRFGHLDELRNHRDASFVCWDRSSKEARMQQPPYEGGMYYDYVPDECNCCKVNRYCVQMPQMITVATHGNCSA